MTALWFCLGIPGFACAQSADRPSPRPLRDVDVLYDVPTPTGHAQQRLRFSVARQAFRIDPPGGGLYVVVDLMRGRMFTVRDADRSVIDMAAPASWMPGVTGGSFSRRRRDSVAGLDCTDWATTDSERRAVLVCITDDGVMLRAATTTGQVLITASRVSFGPSGAMAFYVPDSYRRLSPPPLPAAR